MDKTVKVPVGEIFTEAGAAFNRLAEMTMQLHPMVDSPTGSQIRATLKKKAFEDAGIPVRQISSSGQSQGAQQQSVSQNQQQSLMGKSAEVTLNMLNAHDPEVDVEGLSGDVKLEFETSPDGKLEFETGTEEVTG
ncbi:uncharacterized protein LOC143923301 isoform X3 [Arctopsyche grandis]|uniref:uncharacterized protein LOC143923301 isoform X3 n=1 Tax=Arctopsyche grandis TaxID=121162 RepID=UPI00406D8094